MVTLLANYHWVAARFWCEVGAALRSDWACDRGTRHIEAWLQLVGARYGLKVIGR